jgi:DNA adenine methylase
MNRPMQLTFDLTSEEEAEVEQLQSLLVAEMRNKNKSGKILAIRWYGGKFSHLDWLLPLLPRCQHFCEPFGGSAAVLLNRDPAPVETYNDIDGDLVNFFRVLRDKPEELIEKLVLTPFSREEFRAAYQMRGRADLPDVERARLFFVRAEQVRIGLAQTSTAGRWAWCKLTSRRGMSGSISRWLNRIDALWAVSERLRRVQIENRDAIELIEQYDSPETLFYVDPPYPHEARGDVHSYAYELTEAEHEKLASVLHSVRGKVALSGYRSPLTDRLYRDWTRIDAPQAIIHSVKKPRTESVWINYKLAEIGQSAVRKLKELGVKFHVHA